MLYVTLKLVFYVKLMVAGVKPFVCFVSNFGFDLVDFDSCSFLWMESVLHLAFLLYFPGIDASRKIRSINQCWWGTCQRKILKKNPKRQVLHFPDTR